MRTEINDVIVNFVVCTSRDILFILCDEYVAPGVAALRGEVADMQQLLIQFQRNLLEKESELPQRVHSKEAKTTEVKIDNNDLLMQFLNLSSRRSPYK